jgi:putative flippase GtrA
MKLLLAKLFRDKTGNVLIQLLRYAVVGGVAFAVDIGALIALTEMAGWHYLASAAAGFGLGVATNYVLSVLWVFNERMVHNKTAEFLMFLVLGVFGLGLNELTLYLLTGLAGAHYAVSKVVATALTFAWNFASRKILLFTAARTIRSDSVAETHAEDAEPVTV